MSKRNVAIIVVPRGEIGSSIVSQLRAWFRLGLIEDAFLVDGNSISDQGIENFEVSGARVSDNESKSPGDVFYFLGEHSYGMKNVIVPWWIGDSEADEGLASLAAKFAKKVRSTLPTVNGETRRDEDFFCSLLSIPSYQSENDYIGKAVAQHFYSHFNANIIVSPEIKSVPGGASIPVKESHPNFVSHVAAQIVTVAGLWSGVGRPLTSILKEQNYFESDGGEKAVVIRSMAASVIANDLASKLISDALQRVVDLEEPVYDGTEGIRNRPTAIRKSDQEQIDALLRASRDQIIGIREPAGSDDPSVDQDQQGVFTLMHYQPKPKPKEHDFEEALRVRIRQFFNWIWETILNMPFFAWAWVKNTYASIWRKILTDVKQPVPERYTKLDSQVLERLHAIKEMQDNPDSEENRRNRDLVFKSNAIFLTRLRETVFHSLDTGVRNERRVLPSVMFAAADPEARYALTDEQAKDLIAKTVLNYEEASKLRAELVEEVKALDKTIAEIPVQIQALTSPEVRQENVKFDSEDFENLNADSLERESIEAENIEEEQFRTEIYEEPDLEQPEHQQLENHSLGSSNTKHPDPDVEWEFNQGSIDDDSTLLEDENSSDFDQKDDETLDVAQSNNSDEPSEDLLKLFSFDDDAKDKN